MRRALITSSYEQKDQPLKLSYRMRNAVIDGSTSKTKKRRVSHAINEQGKADHEVKLT